MFELVDDVPQSAVIKVIGVGGGGGNAVHHMWNHKLKVSILFVRIPTRRLCETLMRIALPLGGSMTKGLGAGANPGRSAVSHRRS